MPVHEAVPVEQSVLPVWHALAGVHDAPCVHALHVPLPHTFPAPHEVPFATFPVRAQTAGPFEQTIAPVRHGTVGVHGAPAVHESEPGLDASDVAPSSPGASPELSASLLPAESTAMPASA